MRKMFSVTEWSGVSWQIYITHTEIFTHNIIYSNSILLKFLDTAYNHCNTMNVYPDDCLDDHEPSVYESGLLGEEF